MKINTNILHNILQRDVVEGESDEQAFLRASEKLEQILQNANDECALAMVAEIRSFLETNDVNKRKLLVFCEKLFEPSVYGQLDSQGVEVALHSYLPNRELYKLADFVNAHIDDDSFGSVVYQLMEKHGMTAPQVYRNAMLRRQDFARATTYRGGYNVTKRIAWQIIIGLHCDMDETDLVLASAGYSRRKNELDLIMEYFITQKNYNMAVINIALEQFGLKQFPCYEFSERRGPSPK